MEYNEIKTNDIISGPFWPEDVQVTKIENTGTFIRIVGATLKTNQHIDQTIPYEDFVHIKKRSPDHYFNNKAAEVFLVLESIRYRHASLYDPLLAMNISKVDPLPHQVEAVYGYILKLPRIRFLIADDPGAGKTIMAGLLIKELKLRQLVRRILIVMPGHLKDQWQRELKERFDEEFEVVDRKRFDASYRSNVWEKENQLITSMDFAKQKDVMASLAAVNFDFIIVDEAHKMSAYRYGDKIEKSDRYELGEVLSKISHHLLFLTATPHKGDIDNYRLFLDLLVPGFFANNEMIKSSLEQKDNPLFIRRIKEDLKDFDGKPLFLPRHINTVTFELGSASPQEKELYNELSRYVKTQYNKAITKNTTRNMAFALVILQRRFASSTYALWKSLKRRKERLEELLKNNSLEHRVKEIANLDEVDDLSENERWQLESEWEKLTVAVTKEELKNEIETINNLINMAEEIIKSEKEVKLQKLKESLNELSKRIEEKDQLKILIFTESRDTLEYLEKRIREWGYTLTTIHGGLKLEERIKAEAVFRNEATIMIATEAAGEGINLQFCNLMINYDLPWNPNRLEQRMGRIHRYGQRREVFINNLVANDTREGMVLAKLFSKLEEIRRALGNDKVFDVLGEIIDPRQFTQAILDAAVNAKGIEEILAFLEIKVDAEYLRKVKENLGETLATRYINYTFISELAQKAKELRLIPEYTQSFFIKAFEKAGGKIRKLSNGLMAIESIPMAIRKITEREAFKKQFGYIQKSYPKTTFAKEILAKEPNVEFISFGHPLFEAVMQWVEREFSCLLPGGATFYDPDGKLDGYILFYEGEIKDGTGAVAGKRLFSFFTNSQETRPIHPSRIWDFAEENSLSAKGEATSSNFEIEALLKTTDIEAIKSLQEYRAELLKERERQAEIKEKYGISSLEFTIRTLDYELLDLMSRKEKGENVDLAIRNKQEQKTDYERTLNELKALIGKEKCLTMSTPKFLGAIKVKPLQGATAEMVSDEQIEAIGMQIAMEYEQKQGREPEDVSAQNLGFDIRSKDPVSNSRRYIEVKARAQTGAIALTQNEWFKAQRFGNKYYLYVVYNAATKPELHIITNPAGTIKAEEKVEMVRYLVNGEEIFSKGIKA